MVCPTHPLTCDLLKAPALHPLLLLLALSGMAWADLPKKAPLSRYTGLWTNSPFTSKPPPSSEGPENNPLDDYALIGVSPIGGNGYRVTLINKKKPDERIAVDSGSTKTEFKILEVIRKTGNPLGTTVKMSSGSQVGTVAFDEKLLPLVAAPAAKPPQPMQPGQVPQTVPGQQPQVVQPSVPQPAGATPQIQRQPRPRVVPPSTGGQTQPGQPGQPGQSTQKSRPDRRGP